MEKAASSEPAGSPAISRRGTVAWAAALAFFGLTAAASAQAQLNINTALSTEDPIYKGLERMRDKVAERSGGKLTIRIFPGFTARQG